MSKALFRLNFKTRTNFLMTKSVAKKVGLASLIMMGSVFLSRLFGILREIVIAYLNGTDGSVDAYQISFIIPEILNHVLASGFLSITFIPIFSKYNNKKKIKEGWQIFSIILNSFGLLLLVLIGLAWIFTPQAIGLTGLTDELLIGDAIEMTRIIIPAQFFFFAGGLLMAVQFANEKFLIPALAPLIYNLSIILGGIILYPFAGIKGFSWGVLIGAFIGNFAIQWFGARKTGMRYSFTINLKHKELRNYLIVTVPLMLGLTMTFSTEIIPKLFGSYLPEGSVASLNYALRIMFLMVGLFGQAVGVASYPFLSKMAAKNKIDEMNDLLNLTLKQISLVIPFSVLIVILRHEIVFVLLQRGNFDASSTAITSELLIYLMIGAFAFTAQTLVNRGYYALQNTLFPTLYVSFAVLISLPVYYVGALRMGISGIALALSFSTILQVIILFALWNRSSYNRGSFSVYICYIKVIAVSMVAGGFLQYSRSLAVTYLDTTRLAGNIISIVIVTFLFFGVMGMLSYMFKLKEVFSLIGHLTAKFRKIKQT